MLAFFISFCIAALTVPLVISVYTKHKWLDDPQKETHVKKTHTKAVPRGGGLVIFAAVLITSLLFLSFDKYLLAIIVSALLLTIVGTLDDIYNLHPKYRLLAGFIAALIVVGTGIGIAYVTNPFGPGVLHLDTPQLVFHFVGKVRTIWILADIFALFFILWNMNSVNWSKGVDGQLPGFVTVAMIIIGILSSRFVDDPTQFNTTTFSLIVAGAFAGLLLWNWHPQKILPGYGAGSLAGFFLGVTAIISGAKVATVLMVLAIPTADAVFTMLRRVGTKKSPIWGDRGHLHHILLDEYNWSKQQIAFFYLFTTLLIGGSSLFLNSFQKSATIGVVFLVVFGIHVYTRVIRNKSKL